MPGTGLHDLALFGPTLALSLSGGRRSVRPVKDSIETFFARYGAAISSDDVTGIAACYDPPSLLITDTVSTLLGDSAQVAAYFTGMAQRYRARGAFDARISIRAVEQLSAALFLVDVRWDSVDEAGAPAPVEVETYLYLVRVAESDELLIVSVIVTS
jgi:hypothetical protein